MESDRQYLGTVYVIDDDVILLEMMQELISSIGVQVVTYTSARQFIANYREMPGECLVSDVRMPEMNGIELQKYLNEKKLAIPTIFVSGFAEVETAVEAMKHGAFDFIEKPFGKQLFLGKVQAALKKSREHQSILRQEQTKEARLSMLSTREREIVKYVVAGKTSKEIAELLNINVRTVESHRTHVHEKLHVNSTVELVKLFVS